MVSVPQEDSENIYKPIVKFLAHFLKNVTENDLNRAKNRFKSIILSVLEDSRGLSINAACDLLYLGRVRSGRELCEKVDKVTMKDMKMMAVHMFSQKPGVCVIGDVESVGNKYEKVLASINFGRNKIVESLNEH
jgi:predicted Zn-dependent peptidase